MEIKERIVIGSGSKNQIATEGCDPILGFDEPDNYSLYYGTQFFLGAEYFVNSGCSHPDLNVSYQIVEGQQWGWLARYNYVYETDHVDLFEGDVLTTVIPADPWGGFWLDDLEFNAWENEPAEPQQVTVRMTVEGVGSKDIHFTVLPAYAQIVAEADTAICGDTVHVSVKKKLEDGTLVDFPSGTSYYYELAYEHGDSAGYLSTPDGTFYDDEAGWIESASMRVSFEEEGILPDEFVVYIPVTVNDGIDHISQGTYIYETGLCKIVLGKKTKILLGETKYFQPKISKDGTKLRIYHVLSDPPQQLADGITSSSVWPTSAASAIAPDDPKSLYWEKKYPIWSNGTFAGMNDLPAGLIRVVGRYWNWAENVANKVTLHAASGTMSDAIEVEVLKPEALLKVGQTPDYKKSNYIDNTEIDIDELAIKYGGQYGIPPQFLKGQMYTEAQKDNGRFWPSYRYEPWSDLKFRRGPNADADYLKSDANHPFWVDINGMNPDNVTTETQHYNVRPIHYPTSPVRLGDYVADNLSRYTNGSGSNTTFMNPADDVVPMMWSNLVYAYRHELKMSSSDADISATNSFKDFLRIFYYNEWAQTRKAASYGYFQMLFTTAIQNNIGYSRTSLPENLADKEILSPLVSQFIICNINQRFREKGSSTRFNSGHEWDGGFEKMFFEGYHLYNKRRGYPDDVFNASSKFIPSK